MYPIISQYVDISMNFYLIHVIAEDNYSLWKKIYNESVILLYIMCNEVTLLLHNFFWKKYTMKVWFCFIMYHKSVILLHIIK